MFIAVGAKDDSLGTSGLDSRDLVRSRVASSGDCRLDERCVYIASKTLPDTFAPSVTTYQEMESFPTISGSIRSRILDEPNLSLAESVELVCETIDLPVGDVDLSLKRGTILHELRAFHL